MRAWLSIALIGALLLTACGGGGGGDESKVQIEEIVIGTGPEAKEDIGVTVNYTLYLEDGTKVDSSYDRGETLEFTVGFGNVIKGFDEGVRGMRDGGKRRIIIPPELGYGEAGRPPTIPPNATLTYEVEMVDVHSEAINP